MDHFGLKTYKNKQDRKRERLILKELQSSIQKDLASYEENYTWRLEKKKKGLDSLLFFMDNQLDIEESQFIRLYYMMSTDIKIRHDRGPYETLKSTGFNYIKNDSLRTAINRTYTRLPQLEFFASNHDNEYDLKINELENEIGYIKGFAYKDDWISAKYTVNVDNIFSNQNFLKIYGMQARKYKAYKSRLDQIKRALMTLNAQIETELNQ